MFNTQLESKPKKEKRGGGTVASIVMHSVLVGLAVYATANAAIQNEKPRQEKIDFVETPKDEPPPPKDEPPPPPPPDVVAAPPPPKGFQVLTAPIEIPDVIPDIDLNKKVIDESDFSGKGVAGGKASGVEGGKAPIVNSDQPYFEFQVEKPVMQAPNSPSPQYPDILRQAGVEGEALVSFVVDTTGRADVASFKVIRTTHELFATAVKNALPRMRFIPAEVGDKKVRQLVQQPFSFAITK